MKKLILMVLVFPVMCFSAYLDTSFNSGELTPLIRYRVDLDRKYMGVETLENFLVEQQGLAQRRPGTRFVATVPDEVEIITPDPNAGECTPDYPNLQYIENDDFETLRDTTYAVEAPVLNQGSAINSLQGLRDMTGNRAGEYFLTGNIDASATSIVTFVPIGTYGDPFTGTFDGNGFTISNLSCIDVGEDLRSLFGYVFGATIIDTTLTDCVISGRLYCGAFIGQTKPSVTFVTVHNCHSSGTVTTANQGAGGLVGRWDSASGVLSNSSSSCVVTSGSNTDGGLIGQAQSVTITNCFATGSVTGVASVGGFVGFIRTCTVTNCYATGNVTGEWMVGGFIGQGRGDTFDHCYASGDVSSEDVIEQGSQNGQGCGGFIGFAYGGTYIQCAAQGNVSLTEVISGADWGNQDTGIGGFVGHVSSSDPSFTDCYAWGNVTIENTTYPDIPALAGFCGRYQRNSGTFTNCYSIGSVPTDTATIVSGGFINRLDFSSGPTATSCYWDITTSETVVMGYSFDVDSGFGPALMIINIFGKTTTQMKAEPTYSGWDFNDIWFMCDDDPDGDGDPDTITTITSNETIHLISFEYATDDAYVIEAGNQYFRFFKDE